MIKLKFSQSIAFKILFFYILLSLIIISFVISIIFENQAELISRNTRLEAEMQLNTVIDSLKTFSAEAGKSSLLKPSNNMEALDRVCSILSINTLDYLIFSEKGEVIYKTSANIIPPASYVKDGLRSVTALNFSGKNYFLRIDEEKLLMYCYIPLSGFSLGNSILLLEKNLAGLNESLEHLYMQAVYVMLTVFFFHAVFAVILFRNIIKPVNILNRGAENLRDGMLSWRIRLKGRHDEFATLADTFNHMAESLQNNIESLSGKIDSAMASIEKTGKLSTRDELTGLYNRQYILERASEDINKPAGKNAGTGTGFIIIGIDDFSNIIRIYGEQTKNIIVSECAKLISRVSGDTALIARYSDSSFALLLPGSSADFATAVYDKIKTSVSGKTIITPDGDFIISASSGYVFHDHRAAADFSDPAEIFRTAEKNMPVSPSTDGNSSDNS